MDYNNKMGYKLRISWHTMVTVYPPTYTLTTYYPREGTLTLNPLPLYTLGKELTLPLPLPGYCREGTQGCQQTSKGNNIIFGSLLGSYLTYNGLLVSS